MKTNAQSGFSLIELLLVVTIIGIVAALAVPSFLKGIRAADNGAVFATMRAMSSTQLTFLSQNNRFARLDELNNLHGNGLGTVSGTTIIRGRFTFEMLPVTPTDAELREAYTIVATGMLDGGVQYQFRLNQTGEIVQVSPIP
jgi:prepilin-type N-terminal cleavage/methylation domain-containing protein